MSWPEYRENTARVQATRFFANQNRRPRLGSVTVVCLAGRFVVYSPPRPYLCLAPGEITAKLRGEPVRLVVADGFGHTFRRLSGFVRHAHI
jgi:hypothetical protein